MTELTILWRLLAATAMGAAIGIEREYHAKEAGIRTHLLVAVGSCLFMILSAYGFDAFLGRDNVSFDPSRIASQVVTGIGFIGAGTIILQKQMVRGLTTAAGLWVTAAIGLTCGLGMYVIALATTAIVLISLGLLNVYLPYFSQKEHQVTFVVEDYHILSEIMDTLHREKITVLNYEMHKDAEENNGKMLVSLEIRMKRYDNVKGISSILKNFENVEIVQVS
jgi:putative Mg2+ transporter-C (MgtC) family protein